jgi:hypothetical protein
LNFIYNETPPSDDANLIDLYAACGKLEIKDFMEVVAQILIKSLTPENSLEVLNLCQLYPHEKLKMKAFDKFKENFQIPASLSSEPEKLKSLMKLKKEMDQIIASE